MLAELLSGYANLPDVWGEGALFAFSGMDGCTQTASGFVGTAAARPYGLLFHTPLRRTLEISLSHPGRVRVATGDVLLVETGQGELALVYAAWHTLAGCLPVEARLALGSEDGMPAEWVGQAWVSSDPVAGDALALVRQGERFALAYGVDPQEAVERAQAGLGCDLADEMAARLELYRLPILADPGRDRLLKKCLSVMKVNTLSPEAAIAQCWSTPDRVPHRHMWLWDSVFHSLAMNLVDPGLSWEFLKSVLDAQRPDGMIPHMITVDGRTSAITQPPILTWGVWENYLETCDREALAYALPRLEAYLEWDLAERDQDHNGLLEWFIEGDASCRSGESGLDNSPRFDEAILLDAVDFSTFAALDMGYLSRIAGELGDAQRAAAWQARSAALAQAIHAALWDEVDGFYYDRTLDGRFTRVRAATGFLPLLLPDLPSERVQRLVGLLKDPSQFNTAFPVPSLAVSHPAWSTDMWRGATWVNLNYLIALGLRRQGCPAEAGWLASKTIHYVDYYYRSYGVLFEFFDAKDERPPLACDRKGQRVEPYNIRRKYDSIRDYHWTAALVACLLMDEGEKENG